MRTLGLMLTRMVLMRFLLILFGISIFLLTLDIVTYANEILALQNGKLSAIAYYALLRAPAVLSTFIPFSLLLALLLALTELTYRNEIAAFWAAGLSPLRVMIMLIPLAVLVGAAHFAISDRGIPSAAPVLRDWGIGDYGEKQLKVGDRDPIWMRAGPDILRAASSNATATRLDGVVIFRRSPEGLLTEQIFAKEATLNNQRWELKDVVIYYSENIPPDRLPSLIYSGDLRPAAAGARSGDPEEMTLGDLSYFIDNLGFGIRPAFVYETWWHKRLSYFFTSFMMIALCVPLVVRFRRGGGIGYLFAAGVGMGFLFFILDGIALTMGELGFVTPWIAAWIPLVVFSGIAATIALRTERL
jgi:lipopolysaccharide export system permease protein